MSGVVHCSPTSFPSIPRLPDDIIQEIFIWYVNDDPFVDVPFLPITEENHTPSHYWDSDNSDDDDDYSDSPDEVSSFEEKPLIDLPPPFVISRVCSAWRRTALSTPRLWSNVRIATFDPFSKRLATEWLLKAGSCSVSISIYELASFNVYAELREFLSAYHIKSLGLPLLSETCPMLPLLLAELPEERIVHLESLSLEDLESGQQQFVLLDNARYPCLRELQLIGRFQVGGTIIFPWTSLRRLDAATVHLPMMKCLHILRESVSLEVCFLGISSHTGSESTVGDLCLSALRELTLSFNFDADVGDFIQRLTTPNLKILTFERCGLWSDMPLRWSDLEYSRMMQRSNRPLCHLAIRRSNEVDAHSVLKSSPMLVEVSLHRAKFRQETLDDLATGRLVPLLQHFCVDEISGVDDYAVSEMIERRTQNSVSIECAEHRLMPFSSVMAFGGSRMDANFGIVYPPRRPIAYFHETNTFRLCDCISCISRTLLQIS